MSYTTTYTHKVGTTDDTQYYETLNPGWKCTGETLEEHCETRDDDGHLVDGGGCTYVVLTGPFTAWGMCRDCGDHYVIARWSRYDRIEKDTLKITFDVEDK